MTARPRPIRGLPIVVPILTLLTACASPQLKLEMERQVVITPPKIQSLGAEPSGQVDTSDQGQTVKVTLRGDSGLAGSCDALIGQEAQNVALTETQPGLYEGAFSVKQGQTGPVNLVGHLRHEPSGAHQEINEGGLLQLVSRPKSEVKDEGAGLAALSEGGCTGEAGKRLEAQLQAFIVHFDFNNAAVRSDAASSLESVARTLRGADCRIVLAGHTDEVGSTDYNQALSERRAEAVRSYLAERLGIPADRLEATGYGKTRLIDTAGTPEARQQNRRVEIHIVDAR
jgi:outer membrane protein OmpA-like peptidoglycan-associated protein